LISIMSSLMCCNSANITPMSESDNIAPPIKEKRADFPPSFYWKLFRFAHSLLSFLERFSIVRCTEGWPLAFCALRICSVVAPSSRAFLRFSVVLFARYLSIASAL
jgi:hypothetical protein